MNFDLKFFCVSVIFYLTGISTMYIYHQLKLQSVPLNIFNNLAVTNDDPKPSNEQLADSHGRNHSSNQLRAVQEYNNITVLCWVMTSPGNHKTKCKAVKETWGKRCNILLFMSTQTDNSLPAIDLKVPEGRKNLWLKTKAAFKYVFEHHLYQADWFLKADDDTYVIVENLKHMLSSYDTEKPYYFGRKLKGSYNSGGSGYVFSRETLRRFVKIIDDNQRCPAHSLAEDLQVGRCLLHVGVEPCDTLDVKKKETFHPMNLNDHLTPGSGGGRTWLRGNNFHPYKEGLECCSEYSISFHYVPPQHMYQIEYLTYHLKVFGKEKN